MMQLYAVIHIILFIRKIVKVESFFHTRPFYLLVFEILATSFLGIADIFLFLPTRVNYWDVILVGIGWEFAMVWVDLVVKIISYQSILISNKRIMICDGMDMDSDTRNQQHILGTAKKRLIFIRSTSGIISMLFFSAATYFRQTNQTSFQTICILIPFTIDALVVFLRNAILLYTENKRLVAILEKAVGNNRVLSGTVSMKGANLNRLETTYTRFKTLAPYISVILLGTGGVLIGLSIYAVATLGSDQGIAWVSIVFDVATVTAMVPAFLIANHLFRVVTI